MDNGKFSQPRSYREEDRQIEEAFRQVTEKKPSRKPQPVTHTLTQHFSEITDETQRLPPEELLDQEISTDNVSEFSPEIPIEDDISRNIQKTYADLPDVPSDTPDEDAADPDAYEDPSFLNTALDFCLLHWKPILSGLCAAVGIMITILIFLIAGGNAQPGIEDRILPNVVVAGVNVGGMTKEDAILAVHRATDHTYSSQDMVVHIADKLLHLSPKDTLAALDVKAAINAAYAYGHTGTRQEQEQALANAHAHTHTVGLLPYLQLDTNYILRELDALAGSSILTQPSYGLEGTYPSLSVEGFDPNAAQTLVLTIGTPGISIDTQKAYEQILDAYSLHLFQVTIENTAPIAEPDPIDLQAIYEELYTAPVDSRINMQTFQVIPGSYGYDFDLSAAQKQVSTAQYGEVIRIPMRFLEPAQMDETTLFADTLSEYATFQGTDQDRIHNMNLVCEAINGVTVQPGQAFSFLDTASLAGYTAAPVDTGSNSEVVLGGGISQVASVLYYCAMTADLEIISRSAHPYPTSFMDYGMDANVQLSGPDLKFRNSTSYPLQISASLSGGHLTVKLLGTDKRDTFIKMNHEVTNVMEPATEYVDFPYENAEGYLDGDVIQQGITGYTVKTYKQKYSRSTGQLVSKDYETTTRYAAANTLVARVAPPETTLPEATEPPVIIPEEVRPEQTVPEVTAPIIVVPEETVLEATQPGILIPQETQPALILPEEPTPAETTPQITVPSPYAIIASSVLKIQHAAFFVCTLSILCYTVGKGGDLCDCDL